MDVCHSQPFLLMHCCNIIIILEYIFSDQNVIAMTLSMICPSLSASRFCEINLQRLGLISDISFKLPMLHYIMYILNFNSSSDPVYFYMKPIACFWMSLNVMNIGPQFPLSTVILCQPKIIHLPSDNIYTVPPGDTLQECDINNTVPACYMCQ